jgi:hypothetical protein
VPSAAEAGFVDSPVAADVVDFDLDDDFFALAAVFAFNLASTSPISSTTRVG